MVDTLHERPSASRRVGRTYTDSSKGCLLAIKALMVDVDGVLVQGRPEDGRHWQTSVEADLGIAPEALRTHFFAPHWDQIVLGRDGLIEQLTPVLRRLAPRITPAQFVTYWFERDARVDVTLLRALSLVRSAGVRVHLATNQEHLRATYLMREVGLATHVDGIFYSAAVQAKKPDAEFFDRVRASVALGGDEILLIDDSVPNVEAARAAGWQAMEWTTQSTQGLVRRLHRHLFESSRGMTGPDDIMRR